MTKNDNPAEHLFQMLRWAYLKEHRIPPTESFTERVTEAVRATQQFPVDDLVELIGLAYRDDEAAVTKDDAKAEVFIENAWQGILREHGVMATPGVSFAGYLEHYAGRSLRVAAPFAAVLACWLMIVGVIPDIELRKLLEPGF